jgi:hypothetical protein
LGLVQEKVATFARFSKLSFSHSQDPPLTLLADSESLPGNPLLFHAVTPQRIGVIEMNKANLRRDALEKFDALPHQRMGYLAHIASR